MPLSVQTQIEDVLVSLLQGMQLPWPPSAQIQARRLPWDTHGDGTVVIHAGITVYPVASIEAPGTNLREDIGYGVGIAFICPADHSTSQNRSRVSSALEAVRRRLIHDRLTIELTGSDFCQTKVGHLEVNAPKEAHRYEVSGLLVRGWVRESRT